MGTVHIIRQNDGLVRVFMVSPEGEMLLNHFSMFSIFSVLLEAIMNITIIIP